VAKIADVPDEVPEELLVDELDGDVETDAIDSGEYTTETPKEAAPKAPRVVLNVPGAAVGRRKQAIARVRIKPGSGSFVVNGRTLEEYFPNKLHQQLINDPFKVLDLVGSYDVIAKITGGGPSGQAGALRLGIARSLNQIDEENNRASLKKAGFLSRDARVKERKKAGLKKARKAPQFSKR
jgi:small subunit ribosomal protein S9